MTTPVIILIITAILTALSAGLFYSYSCSINPGLGRLNDHEYLAAMQSINRAILNPVFFASFLGTLLLLPVSTWLHYGSPRFTLLLIASIVYIVGVFGVTMVGNVPLNNMLDAFDLRNAGIEEMAKQRSSFEAPWNRLHTIRTVAVVVSLALVIVACIRGTQSTQ